MKKISFIGVGIMGKSMVRNLMKAGFELHIYARTKAKVEDVISEKASETSGNVTITAMVESTDQEIDSEWLGTFTDSGRLEISYRELSLSVQWSGHIATFTWTLKR